MRTSVLPAILTLLSAVSCLLARTTDTKTVAAPKRLVILKVDGLSADLLYSNMRRINPSTGQPVLPWFEHIFGQDGVVFENFYTRGLSLSAPSWSMLDTGHHTVIRGNAEWDRYTNETYDYLNFFPFYLGYARNKQIDMQGVEVLDRAGIPLVIDHYDWSQVFQGFQLYQRGARWTTLRDALERRFSAKVLIPSLESAGTPGLDEILGQQIETELVSSLFKPQILYLDYYTGEVDHEGHATNDVQALLSELKKLDALAGRIWTEIQNSDPSGQTVFVVVSDHGMNNTPDVHSQAFSLTDLLNSKDGGAHHVVLNRHQLSDFKMRALNPLIKRALARSTDSFYLSGEAVEYPTAWLDVDGNERASLSLRNSDLNKIHVLLLQLANVNLRPDLRKAVSGYLSKLLEVHQAQWSAIISQLQEELWAIDAASAKRKIELSAQTKKFNHDDYVSGRDKAVRRQTQQLSTWEDERDGYKNYIAHVEALMNFRPDANQPFTGKIDELIPERTMGDANSLYDLQNYVVGPGPDGMVVNSKGDLDEQRSFRVIDYFPLLAEQRVRNNPQPSLSSKPIDFTAVRLPDYSENGEQTYWLYATDDDQLLIRTDAGGELALEPVKHLRETRDGHVQFEKATWHSGLPLELFEDSELRIPVDANRAAWLSGWHSESEWMRATHHCRYSNGVIGVTEELSPVAAQVPGTPGMDPILLRYERRRRELVQPDIEILAADHWNFNVRNFNPGGNHGSFFRISTHSVWMMAGAGISAQRVEEPYDSLNFASTVLEIVGKPAPMPDRVVHLTAVGQAAAQ